MIQMSIMKPEIKVSLNKGRKSDQMELQGFFHYQSNNQCCVSTHL